MSRAKRKPRQEITMQERKTTIGEYHWQRDAEQGGGAWIAEDPAPPDGDGWRLEGAGMYQGVFAWFWVREVLEGEKIKESP